LTYEASHDFPPPMNVEARSLWALGEVDSQSILTQAVHHPLSKLQFTHVDKACQSPLKPCGDCVAERITREVITFEIRPSNNRLQPYYFRIVASNGRVLASSETYVNKQDVINAVNLIKQNAATARFIDYTKAA